MSSPSPSDAVPSEPVVRSDPASRFPLPRPADDHDRLGAAVRALADAVVRTGAPHTDIADVSAQVEAITERLTTPPEASYLQDSPFHPLSMVGGTAHPSAPQVRVQPTADGVAGTVVLGPAHEGGPGLAHGGIVALIFDHVLGQAMFVCGHSAMTGSLTVKYRRPTRLEIPLEVRASVVRREGRRLFGHAELLADGEVTAEAEALFVQLTADNVKSIFHPGRLPDGPPPGAD